MAIVPINVGAAANDDTGDTLRDAFIQVNANEDDLQTQVNDKADNASLGTAAAADTGDFATAAQGATADTAIQLGDLATVATSGDYDDLSGKPTLGTAAAENVGAFATSAQGSAADTAVQPGDPVLINAQTGTAYTLVLSDAGKLVTLANAGAITVTVPANATVAFPIGTVIALQQLGAGAVSIEGTSGVTINGTTPGDETLTDGQYTTGAALTKHATDTWTLGAASDIGSAAALDAIVLDETAYAALDPVDANTIYFVTPDA